MSAQKKTAGVLDIPTTASKNHYTSTVASGEINSKSYETLQANFALLGHVMQHNRASITVAAPTDSSVGARPAISQTSTMSQRFRFRSVVKNESDTFSRSEGMRPLKPT
jgi:hypothetical protein